MNNSNASVHYVNSTRREKLPTFFQLKFAHMHAHTHTRRAHTHFFT